MGSMVHSVLECSVAQALVELLVLGSEAVEGLSPYLDDDRFVLAKEEIFIKCLKVLEA